MNLGSRKAGDCPPADPRCSGCRPPWGEQPPAKKYRELIDTLANLEMLVDAGADQPRAARMALTAVISYLIADPFSARLRLTRLLAATLNDLNDISRGANPSRVFHHSSRKGGPIELSKAAFRAQINIMFETLTKHLGMGRNEAGKLLADKLRQEGIKEDGAAISSRTIMRWHGEIGAKSLSGSDKVYRRLKEDLDRKGWPSHKQAQAFIKSRILVLRAAGHV
jgi:hypothetical protein